MARKSIIYGGLDVGASKTCVAIGRPGESVSLEILGVGKAPTHGMRKSHIIDPKRLISSIEIALKEAVRQAGETPEWLCCTLPADLFTVSTGAFRLSLGRGGRQITEETLHRWVHQAAPALVPEDHVPIHCFPRTFALDGALPAANPVGMEAEYLDGEAAVASIPATLHKQWAQLLKSAGFPRTQFALEPVSAAEFLLKQEDRERGVLLADIGAELTQVGWFEEGVLQGSFSLEVGGNHITNDIAYLLKIPFEEAEGLKVEFGSVIESSYPLDYPLQVTTPGKQTYRALRLSVLLDIIAPRVEEMLTLIRENARERLTPATPKLVCLTGGTTHLPGLFSMANQVFDTSTWPGSPLEFSCASEDVCDPITIVAIGALAYVSRNQRVAPPGGIGLRTRFSAWLDEFF